MHSQGYLPGRLNADNTCVMALAVVHCPHDFSARSCPRFSQDSVGQHRDFFVS